MNTLQTVRRVRNAVKWMRRNYRVILTVLTFIFVAILAFALEPQASAVMAMALPGIIVDGTEGGKHVVDEPLTTDLTREASPSLLLNEIDQQIVKVRPMATPLDQLSRYGGGKHSGSMIVDYYSVDTKPTRTQMSETYTEGDDVVAGEGTPKVRIITENDEIFDKSDTILVQGVQGYEPDGTTMSVHELVLYVAGRDAASGLKVMGSTARLSTVCPTVCPPSAREPRWCAWGAPPASWMCSRHSSRLCRTRRRTTVRYSRCRSSRAPCNVCPTKRWAGA